MFGVNEWKHGTDRQTDTDGKQRLV